MRIFLAMMMMILCQEQQQQERKVIKLSTMLQETYLFYMLFNIFLMTLTPVHTQYLTTTNASEAVNSLPVSHWRFWFIHFSWMKCGGMDVLVGWLVGGSIHNIQRHILITMIILSIAYISFTFFFFVCLRCVDVVFIFTCALCFCT